MVGLEGSTYMPRVLYPTVVTNNDQQDLENVSVIVCRDDMQNIGM